MIISLATKEQERVAWSRSHSEWGKTMALENYLDREELQQETQLVKESLHPWVLVPKDDPKTLDFLCACESFRRKALVVVPSESTPREVYAHGIASVFCPTQNRKKGYAAHMMKLLGGRLRNDDNAFSYLYSDVGNFYERAGWFVPEGAARELKILIGSLGTTDKDVTLLEETDIDPIIEKDLETIKKEMKAMATNGVSKAIVCPLPSIAGYHWNIVRENFYADLMKLPKFKHRGAKIGQNFIFWNHDIPSNVLYVLRLRSDNVKDTTALLAAADAEAKQTNLKHVAVWTGSKPFHDEGILKGLDIPVQERTSSLPAVAWYLADAGQNGNIDWYINERALWC